MSDTIKSVSNINLAAFAEALAAKVPLKSDLPTKVSDLANDTGFTTNEGTITSVTLNGTTTSSGDVDLGYLVVQEGGKGLSSNDYTALEKTKLEGIETGAQVNTIETISVNETTITPVNKAVDITVPTMLSDLSDDATHRVVTDTEKSTWSGKQDALTFDSAPTENSSNPVTSGGLYTVITNNELVVSSALNDLNTRVLDLEDTTVPTKTSELQNDSGFITTESDPTVPAWAKSATKPTYTAAEVGALPDTTVIPDVSGFFDEVSYDSGTKRINFKQGTTVKKYIDATNFIKDGMIDSVGISTPESGSNAGVSCLVVTFNVDAGKEDIEIPLSNIFNPSNYYTKTEINSGFVAQESGKGLSSEDYTSAEKTKLSGIETGAQVNVKPDWNAASGTSAEILNKPTIPSSLSDLSDDATHRVVTDTEKSTWSGKQDSLTFDTVPTENSTNPVTSGGLYSTIAETEEVVSTAINNINNRLLVIENTPIPTKVSDLQNDLRFTTNSGTITGITMNGASKGTSGVIDLGTVITSHQDITGKADKSAAIGSLSLSMNSSTYTITLSGTKVDGTAFTVANAIDLPLESVVVNGSYNSSTQKIVLTLQNGNTVDFSVADLVSGLQSEITSANKLSADLISDGTTNKTVTATEKSTWSGKQDALTFDTVPTENSTNPVTSGGIYQTIVNNEFVVSTALNDLNTRVSDLEEVEVPTKTSDLTNDSGFLTSHQDISGKANVADLATVATSGSYNDLSDKPTIPAGVVVDQTFDATSANPQSGVAIASALSGKQDTISDLATIRSGAGLGATAYQKPSTGIPASDLASGVIPDVTGKADKVSSPTSGNFAGLDSNGNLTDSGSKATDFATAAQGALASSAYQKPASGIPASDLASGVIPDISGKENTSNKVTSLSAQSTDTQYPSAKATYDAIYPSVQTTQPQGGMLPNVFYNLGLLSANTTFSLATPVDANILNHYYWVLKLDQQI